MRIAISSFESFGGREINASTEILKLIDGVDKYFLKVSWNDNNQEIENILNNNYDLYILLGEAGSYDNMTIELRAHNICNGLDNYGINKNNEVIDNNYNDYLETNLNFDKLDIDCKYNYDCGKYLCNYSYFNALKHNKTKCVFIHFPFIKEEGGKFDKEELALSLKKVIEYLINFN